MNSFVRCFTNLGSSLLRHTGISRIIEEQKKALEKRRREQEEDTIPFSMLIDAAREEPRLSTNRRILVAAGLEQLIKNINLLSTPVMYMSDDSKRNLAVMSTEYALKLRPLADGVPALEKLADAVLRDLYRCAAYARSPLTKLMAKIEVVLPKLKNEAEERKSKLGNSHVPQTLYDVRTSLGCYESNGKFPDLYLSDIAANLLRAYRDKQRSRSEPLDAYIPR